MCVTIDFHDNNMRPFTGKSGRNKFVRSSKNSNHNSQFDNDNQY